MVVIMIAQAGLLAKYDGDMTKRKTCVTVIAGCLSLVPAFWPAGTGSIPH